MIEIRCRNGIDSIIDFSYFRDFYGAIDALEEMTMPENWKYSADTHGKRNTRNPILENYIHHTFKRLWTEYRQAPTLDEKNLIIYCDDKIACFNTGLFTPNYNKIYALFYRASKDDDRKPFTFGSFEQEASYRLSSIKELPRRANYFTNVSDLIYDCNLPLRANVEHILQENKYRFPKVLHTPMLPTLFTGAVDIAKKKVQANYKVAVPTYFKGEICLMLPLCLLNPEKPDIALAIKKEESFYAAKTCLTLDMAYNDARLIAKPNADWLVP